MFSLQEMPSPSSIFSAYASMTASVMLVRSVANDLIPYPLRGYLYSAFRYFFTPRSANLTLIIEECTGIGGNQVYDAAEAYLSKKISSDTSRVRISKNPNEKSLIIRLDQGEKIVDFFDGIKLEWIFIWSESGNGDKPKSEKRLFELKFHKRHKEQVLERYIPYVLDKAKSIKDEETVLKMHTLNSTCSFGGGTRWDSIHMDHPSTFETLAMDPELKSAVIDDLNRFVRRKEFYKKVGKAWKRGYLLYGPPGTGKSSLIAAMANYLRFDVYDLQLAGVMRDSDLRKLLLTTSNRSILVIEDIDCSVDLPDRQGEVGRKQRDLQLTLSGLLNFIDGLWSSCGQERIIVFTTNHKERLDPALLRPGRMDMHIHMSYCSFGGFKLLASNYLGIVGHHKLFGEIEGLLDTTEVTPAQVAEQLMKSEDADVALEGLVSLLKLKKMEGSDLEDEAGSKNENQNRKRQKIQHKPEEKSPEA